MNDIVFLAFLFGATLLCAWLVIRFVANRLNQQVVARTPTINDGPLSRFISNEALLRLRLGVAWGCAGIIFLIGLVVGLSVFVWIPLMLGAAYAGWRLPLKVYQHKAEQRRADFERQMLNVVLGLAGNVKAGMGITQALATLAQHTPGVVREELMIVVEELPVCKDVNEAFDHLYERVPCEDLLLMKSAIRLSTKSGGRLTEIMTQLAETIRERTDFRERLKNRVAQGKFEAILMACAPIGIFLILLLIDTQLMLLLVTHPAGWVALVIVAILEMFGFLWIRKIVNIEV